MSPHLAAPALAALGLSLGLSLCLGLLACSDGARPAPTDEHRSSTQAKGPAAAEPEAEGAEGLPRPPRILETEAMPELQTATFALG